MHTDGQKFKSKTQCSIQEPPQPAKGTLQSSKLYMYMVFRSWFLDDNCENHLGHLEW